MSLSKLLLRSLLTLPVSTLLPHSKDWPVKSFLVKNERNEKANYKQCVKDNFYLCNFSISIILQYFSHATEKKLDRATSYEEDVYLRLEDEAGNVLYNYKFNDKNFSKKFRFDLGENNVQSLRWV